MLNYVLHGLLLILSIGEGHSATPAITDFPNPEVSISETTSRETVLETVTVTDADNDPISCEIQSSTPNGPFEVWKKDGDSEYRLYFVVGSTTQKLNFTLISKYNLVIECSDKDGSDTKTLTVKVTGNQPPVATGLPTVKSVGAKAAEYQTVNSIVYTISIKDPENDLLIFTMYSDPDLGYFKIDQYTGQIKTAIDLRSATVDTIPLNINVTDGYNTIGPLKVTIKLTGMNQRPEFTNLPANVTVKEDAAEGDVITVLTFTDADPYKDLEPSCSVFPSTEKYKFTFEKSSNKIKLSTDTNEPQPLNYETTNYYKITCVLFDGYLYNEGDYINLIVLDVNEEPSFKEDKYQCVLYESQIGVSQCDLPLKVTDPDDDKVDIVLLSGNNSERFALVNNDKKLTFNINYDVDDNAMPTDVLLTAGVVDEHGLTGTTKIAITVRDRNDNTPEFTSTVTSFVISETQDVGSLGKVTAQDKDSGDNGDVTYSVKGGSQALGYVSLLGDGEVRYSSQYPESMGGKSELILVEAKDNGDPRLSSTGTVIVTFQPYSTTTTKPTTVPPTVVIVTNPASSSSSSSSFLDNSASVGLLAALLSLLFLGLAGLLAYCLCCRGGGRCSGGQSNVQSDKVRRVYPDDYYRDSRHYSDYENSELDYDDKRDRTVKDRRSRNSFYDNRRNGSPQSVSQVKLLGSRDLPRIA